MRELRNIVERLAYLSTESIIDESQVDFVRSPRMDQRKESDIDLSLTLADATDVFQMRFIEEHIKSTGGNIT